MTSGRRSTGCSLELDLACIALRGEQQVADEPQQPVRIPAHDAEEAQLLLVQAACLTFDHQLHVAADGGQRGAQLVRDGGDEVVLHPVELSQAVVLLDLHAPSGLRLLEESPETLLTLGEVRLAFREILVEPAPAIGDRERDQDQK